MPEHGNSSPDKKRKVMILTHGLYPVPGIRFLERDPRLGTCHGAGLSWA